MNYDKLYSKLIEKRINNPLIGPGEKHHILAKCQGGTDNSDNIVLLSYKEHLFAHLFLSRMYPTNSKLGWAFHAMCFLSSARRKNQKPSLRQIGEARKNASIHRLGKGTGEEAHNYVKTKYKFINRFTLEIIEETPYRFAQLNYLSRSEVNNLVRYSHRYSHDWGIVLPDGSYSFNKPSNTFPEINKTCEYCGKIISIGNYSRWHGENCKLAPNPKRFKMPKLKCSKCGKLYPLNCKRQLLNHESKCS